MILFRKRYWRKKVQEQGGVIMRWCIINYPVRAVMTKCHFDHCCMQVIFFMDFVPHSVDHSCSCGRTSVSACRWMDAEMSAQNFMAYSCNPECRVLGTL